MRISDINTRYALFCGNNTKVKIEISLELVASSTPRPIFMFF